MTRRRFAIVGREIAAAFGDRAFWRTVEIVSQQRREARRPYFTREEFACIEIAAREAVERGDGLPEWAVRGVLRQRDAMDAARQMGISEAEAYTTRLRAEKHAAEQSARMATPLPGSQAAKSSSGRTRVA